MVTSRAFLPVIVAVTVVLAACASGFTASHDSDPEHDFGGYRTYAWISDHPMIVGETSRIPNPLLESRIMGTIEEGMTARGFNKVNDPEIADFVLSFTVGSREEIRVDSYPSSYAGYGYGRGARWGGAYYGMGTETNVRQYQKGMLALDVFDVAEHRPVWHGVATKSITESDRKKIDETVRAAVDAILAGFPPR